MKIVEVKFITNGDYSEKNYYYITNLDLINGAIYNIVADGFYRYANPIIIINNNIASFNYTKLREITSAQLLDAPHKPDGDVENIWLNEYKGVVVVKWADGTKTKVRCQDGEEFDAEKGIALCFMKKAFNNRGCYNDIFKKYIEEI